jgi:ABC-type uncharacterized transport system permease subunit
VSDRIVPGVGDARRLVYPGSAARQARENPAPTVILLVVALAAIQAFKAGQLPSIQTAGALTVGAIAFVLIATVAPEIVTYSLLLVLLWASLTNAPVLEQAVARVTSKINF